MGQGAAVVGEQAFWGCWQGSVALANSSLWLFVHAGMCTPLRAGMATLPRRSHFNAAFSPDENIHILIKKKKYVKYKFASMIISVSQIVL